MFALTKEETMKAQRNQDLTEEMALLDDPMDVDLEAWMPQDFDRFDEFGASPVLNQPE